MTIWTGSPNRRASGYLLAAFYLGDWDLAFSWLDRAIDIRDISMIPSLKCQKDLDPLREDPRFDLAMQRLAEVEAECTRIPTVAYNPGAE